MAVLSLQNNGTVSTVSRTLYSLPCFCREFRPPQLEDVAALRAENEALKAELAALKASATTQLGKL